MFQHLAALRSSRNGIGNGARRNGRKLPAAVSRLRHCTLASETVICKFFSIQRSLLLQFLVDQSPATHENVFTTEMTRYVLTWTRYRYPQNWTGRFPVVRNSCRLPQVRYPLTTKAATSTDHIWRGEVRRCVLTRSQF